MFRIFIIVLIIFVILLFPIPIKISLKYINRELYLNIYRKKFDIRKYGKNRKNKASINKKKAKRYQSLNSRKIILMIKKLTEGKLKPKLWLKIKLNYGFDDAAKTAIYYAYLYTLVTMLFNIFNVFFKVSKKDFHINPSFNKMHFDLEINSILFINLANIIYIAINFFSERKNIYHISKEEI